MTDRDARRMGPLRGYRLANIEAGKADIFRESGEWAGRVWWLLHRNDTRGSWWAVDRAGEDIPSKGHPTRRAAVSQVIEEDMAHGA